MFRLVVDNLHSETGISDMHAKSSLCNERTAGERSYSEALGES